METTRGGGDEGVEMAVKGSQRCGDAQPLHVKGYKMKGGAFHLQV